MPTLGSQLPVAALSAALTTAALLTSCAVSSAGPPALQEPVASPSHTSTGGPGTGRSTAPSGAPTFSSPSSTTTPSTAASTAPSASLAVPSSSASASVAGPSESAAARVSADDCAALVNRLGVRDRIGQLLMASAPSTGASERQARALSSARVGSVVLLGNTNAGRAGVSGVARALRASTERPAGVRVLLAVDQEGGLVQRLGGRGFSTIPSAAQQARRSPAAVGRSAVTWGRQLRRAGIHANLAPVADVVPEKLVDVNEPIGRLGRGYGADPERVGHYIAAVVGGLHQADVATALKHFPGLGEVRGNTDFTARVVDRTTTRHDASLESFVSGIGARTDMVMISSAIYARIDPDRRAAYSSVVIEDMLRDELGFAGVVVSDDLTAPGLRDQTAGDRVLRFLRAGGDLAIVSDSDELAGVVRAIRAAVEDDPAFAAQVDQKVRRIVAMKDTRGLATC